MKKAKGVPISEPKVTFTDMGGCDKVLKTVCKLLAHMKHPEIFKQLGISPPRGFLLHGPPGCGKTLLAYAIAGVRDYLIADNCILLAIRLLILFNFPGAGYTFVKSSSARIGGRSIGRERSAY